MANLIPPKARTVVTREYWVRTATVWMLLAAGAGVVTAVFMAPTYVLVSMQHDALENRAATVRSQQESYAAAAEEIERANALIEHIDRNREAVSAVALIKTLDTLTGSSVSITRVSFMQDRRAVEPIAISGVAANRTALANFRDALEASDLITSVDLPISNLAGDRDIPFSITLELRNE